MPRFIMLLLAACCCVGPSHAAQLVIVGSDNSAAYTEATDAIMSALEKGGVARTDMAYVAAADAASMDFSGATAPKVLVTLGALAFQKLLARELRIPIVASLIPRGSYERVVRESERKPSMSLSALYLDQPWGRQLDLLHLALPEVRRVGVLWGTESVVRKSLLVAAAQERGLEIIHGVASGTAVFTELKAVLDGSEVLLAVPDPQVFNSSTISNLLLSTYRARIPMVAFSPAYVKAGALLSLHSTPEQIGTQTAGIARTVLQGGAVAPAQYPMEFIVTVNERVAQSMGLQLNAAVLSERLHKVERRP